MAIPGDTSVAEIFEDIAPMESENLASIVSNRIKETDTQNPLIPYLNFKSTGSPTVIQLPDGEFAVHSRPALYDDQNKNLRIIDLVVVDPSEQDARATFEKKKKFGEEIREAGQAYVRAEILPQIKACDEIVAVIGRGDIYDRQRVPSDKSDIDLMVFVSGENLEEDYNGAVKAITELAVAHPGVSFSVNKIIIGEKGSHSEMVEVQDNSDVNNVNINIPRIQLSFEIIPLKPVLDKVTAASSTKDFEIRDLKLSKMISPYLERVLTSGGEVLYDTTGNEERVPLGDLEKLRQIVLTMHRV